MLEDRLKSVKNHGTNALILCLGVSALVPLVTHLGSAREQSETFIALACITVWVIRKLGYTVLTIINQQKRSIFGHSMPAQESITCVQKTGTRSSKACLGESFFLSLVTSSAENHRS